MKLPYEKLEKLKRSHKLGIFFGTLVLIGVIFYFLLFSPTQVKIADAEGAIDKLENKIIAHRKIAGKIPEIKKRLKIVELEFEFSKQFLPDKKEVPQLLRSISDNGSQSGLNVLLFQPKPQDEPKDFYAEISFDMKVEGPYLNVASFLYRIGRLNRIVNISNVQMSAPKTLEGEIILTTSCVGKTFRFLTPEEIQAREAARQAAQKRGKKR